jgi:assimilatory nitrate reductase electron transfer subunit
MILVIGNGAAAVRLTHALREHGHEGPVTVVGRGPHRHARQRALAPALLDGTLTPAAVTLPGHPPGTRVLTRTTALRIDRRRRRVALAGEERAWSGYDTLVLALGSRPLIPRVPGLLTDRGGLAHGVATPRAARAVGRRVVVLGGGRSGTEAALALRRGGRKVAVVHPGPYPMSRHLDPAAGALLAAHLADRGVVLYAGRRAVEYVPGKLTLDDGRIVGADTVLLCTGTVPRTRLAAEAGLTVHRGVVVDERLRTGDPHISALGACARQLPPAAPSGAPVTWDQAEALAARLVGAGESLARSPAPVAPPPVLRLHEPGLDLAVMGQVPAPDDPDDDSGQVVTFADPSRRRYARLSLREGRVVNAVLLGLPRPIAAVTQLYQRGQPLPATRLALLLGTAPLPAEPVDDRTADQDTALVCHCNHVTRRELSAAWHKGAQDVGSLAEATRATTGCGGCAVDVARLCTQLGSRS